MVRQGLMQTVSREPADGDIHLRFPHQPTVVNDAQQKAREHQSNRHLGVDARPAVTVTVQTGHFLTQPGQIEHPVHPRQKVVVRDQLPQRTTDEQLQLTALLAPQHLVASPTQATTILSKESRPCGFFNSPRVHFMRNALAHAGKNGRRVVSAFIAAAFAQDDADAAKAPWRKVADQLRPTIRRLAEFMDEAETDVLAYMTFPKDHRTKIHSTNPLERLNSDVKRRTEAVGIFPNEDA